MRHDISLRGAAVTVGVLLLAVARPASAADSTKSINDYLVDISGGAVSASGLIGVDKSAVATIQTTQDIVTALQPATSGDQHAGFGLAVTPARTSFLPMSASTYLHKPLMRLVGNLTLSYAQNTADYASAPYRQRALSLDTVAYFQPEKDDPVDIGERVFKACGDAENAGNQKAQQAILQDASLDRDAKTAALAALTDALDKTISACMDDRMKKEVRWNSGRISISYGQSRIKGSGTPETVLGRAFTVNAQYPLGTTGMVQATARATRDAVDTSTLGTASLVRSNSTLVALRLTKGDQATSQLRWLAEVSNAKSQSAGTDSGTFMYALGIDKQVTGGAWISFRLGRNRSVDNGKEQTAALTTFTISPTLLTYRN